MSFTVRLISEPTQRGLFTVGKLYRTVTPKNAPNFPYVTDNGGIPRPISTLEGIHAWWVVQENLSVDDLVELGYITREQVTFNGRMEALGHPGAAASPPSDDTYAMIRLLFPEHKGHDVEAALEWYAMGSMDMGALCDCGEVLRTKIRAFLAARSGTTTKNPQWQGIDLDSPDPRFMTTGRLDAEADLKAYGFEAEERR
jgi:hypothetical protein